MAGRTIDIRSQTGSSSFDCYLSVPEGTEKTPAVVLGSAVHGVTKDLCDIADEFAAAGYIAAAPNLFWRSAVPGPLAQDDKRAGERARPRLEKIKDGEADIADTLAEIRKLPQSNGRAIAMGFCYGGPYAILGPKRLGFDAGISCHGSQMISYVDELEGLAKPLCILWGDQDHAAPPDVVSAYRTAAGRMSNLELHIFPGVPHGYMMPGSKAYDAAARSFSMARALSLLEGLRGTDAKRRAS
jgi:carboxymethylenebutenolidase